MFGNLACMRIGQWAPFPVSLVAGSIWVAVSLAVPAPRAAVSYQRDVLPIFSDKCFKCHGPDSGSRKAGLRLDTAEGAFSERDGRYAISPGKPERSLIIQRMNDHEAPMPPMDSGKTLAAAERETIRRWIAEGAKYGKHWSFDPVPAVVPVPKVASSWPKDDIDRFILARLNQVHLNPSAEAPKLRWLRRVTYDLTGLPPSEAEIAAFLKEPNYAKTVDRLLQSPRYGERMAIDWLDAARYSDSYGYQSDLIMPSWPYRDWVVKAFNENLPYDKFLTYQIAGDRLPNPTRDQRLATAFNRLHRQSNEGGSIAAEYRNEYAVDRTDTFGTAVLGLTVGCARCHDHKFDPISQREYYQLQAYFNSINEFGLLLSSEVVPTPSMLLPTKEQEAKLTLLRKADADAHTTYEATYGKGRQGSVPVDSYFNLDSLVDGKYQDPGNPKAFAVPIGNVATVSGHDGKAIMMDGDNGLVVRGLPARERWDEFTWGFWMRDTIQSKTPVVVLHRTGGTDVGFCGFDLILEDGFLTARVMRHWPGNAIAIRAKVRVKRGEWTHVTWSWNGSGRASGLRLYLNGDPIPTETLQDSIWKKINAYGDLGPGGGDWTFGTRFREAGFKGGCIDGIAFLNWTITETVAPGLCFGSRDQRPVITACPGEVEQACKKMRDAQKALDEFEETIPEISVMQDTAEPTPTYVLARGRYDAPKTAATLVHRGVPKVFPALRLSGTNDRLALAKWVTDGSHPLTARVAVNRMWQSLFGTGLVESSENFGVQGSRPTHPELLDYLAREFVKSGWNVKAMMKRLVLSATYRQDSVRTAKLNAVDPLNRFYARGPSYRLSGEMIRDTVLSAAGLLSEHVGGPPVNPYQPAGIWTENNTMTPAFVQSKGADLYRRSLYSTWKRTTPVPSMMLFDATSREACTVRRPATNTPLQALVLLNDVQFVEAARVLAQNVLAMPTSDADRIRVAFARLAGRSADAAEVGILLDVLRDQRAQFAADAKLAPQLLKLGDSKVPAAMNVNELAAMTVTVQTIMNSDAVVWKR